jgi:hypothetical protein
VAQFDAKKVSPVDWGVIGGGALALISLFLPWWGFDGFSANGWDVGFLCWFGVLLVVAAGAIVLMRNLGRDMPQLPVGEYTLAAGLAVIGAVLVLFKFADLPSGNGLVDYGRKLGAYLGLLSVLVAAGAAIKSFMDSGEKPAWDASKMPGRAAGSRTDASGYVPPADAIYPAPPTDAGIYPPPPPPVTAPEVGHGHDHDHDGRDHAH